jgi:hypothetical protein
MSKDGKYLVYCIEIYRREKRMTGKQVIGLFKKYGIMDYILSCYEDFHTTAWQYAVEDIDLFIEAMQTI